MIVTSSRKFFLGRTIILTRNFSSNSKKQNKMPLEKITIESTNKQGSLPGYVSSGNQKAGVIVIQEVAKVI